MTNSNSNRGEFLGKVFAVVVAGVSGIMLVLGGLGELKHGVGSAVIGLLCAALGVGLVVTAWKIMGNE